MEPTLVSEQLSHFVDYLIDVIGSGRLGFDDAVREYVQMQPGTIATALQNYVKAINATGRGPDSEFAMMETRRNELRAFAALLNTPDAFALAEALIKSQDENINLVYTLISLKSN